MKDFLCNVYTFFKSDIVGSFLFFLMLYTSSQSLGIYFCLAFSIVVLSTNRIFTQLTGSTNLFLFSFFYFIILFLNHQIVSWTVAITYLISPVAFYLYGKRLFSLCSNKYMCIDLMIMISIVFSLYVYVNSIISILENGLINTQMALAIGGDVIVKTATLYGLNVSLGLFALPILLCYYKDLTPVRRFLLFFLLISSILVLIHLTRRTGLVVCLICLVITYVHYAKTDFKKYVSLLIVILIVFYLIKDGGFTADVIEAYHDRNSDSQNLMTGGDRTNRWIDAFANLLSYPFGWSQTVFSKGYVHNAWLDVARVSGIIPFVFLSIATIQALKIVYRLSRYRSMNVSVIIAFNVVFFFHSFMEPVFEGLPIYFYMYCMLWGVQYKMYRKLRYLDNNKM